MTQAKIGFEKLCRNQEDQLHEASEKNAELSREMADMNAANARLTAINDGNLKTLEEKQQLVHQLTRTKNAQLQEIDMLKKSTDEEARAKTSLANALQQTQRELEALRDHHEEELIVKAELQRTLSRANNEVAQWRTKYETDSVPINTANHVALWKMLIDRNLPNYFTLKESQPAIVINSALEAIRNVFEFLLSKEY